MKLKIKSLGRNKTEVTLNNITILFSYAIPVLARVKSKWYVNNKYYTPTTKNHVDTWSRNKKTVSKPPRFFIAYYGSNNRYNPRRIAIQALQGTLKTE